MSAKKARSTQATKKTASRSRKAPPAPTSESAPTPAETAAAPAAEPQDALVAPATEQPANEPAAPASGTATPEVPAPDAGQANAQELTCPNCRSTTSNVRPSGFCSEWCEQEGSDADRRRGSQPAAAESTAPPAAPTIEGNVPSKKMSALDAAAKVLGETSRPMNCQELIGAMAVKGYWTSPGGKTPHSTLYAAIGKEIATKGDQSRFVKADRGKFALARSNGGHDDAPRT
jgi:hypothetical protein